MIRASNKRISCWLLALAVAAPITGGYAQYRRYVEEPRWLRLRIAEVSAGVYAEARNDEVTFRNNDSNVSYNRIFVGPSVGLVALGSIYHPNLVRFYVNSEGAYGWARQTVENGATTIHRNEMEYLGRFEGNVEFLANKPLRGSIFGNYDHTFRDYDFFNRVTVDSLRYGSRVNYTKDQWNVGFSYTHQQEESDSLAGFSSSENDTLNLSATHTRESGATTFGYNYNQYSRTDFGSEGTGGDHAITLSDYEAFGSDDRIRLNTSLSYFQRDIVDDASQEFYGTSSLAIDHRDDLTSLYDASYNRYQSDVVTSDNYSGRAQLRHQLYESLTSTLIGQASNFDSSDGVSSGHHRRFGGGLTEEYTKRLGDDHRMRMMNSFLIEHVDQQSISTVVNERHTFGEVLGGAGSDGFFLNLPNVIEATIMVTDQNDTAPAFVRGFDYTVTTLGLRTLIQRVPGSRIPAGAPVLVDYETQPQQGGSYQEFSEVFQIRFDLFKNLWGVYGRLNLHGNNAATNIVAQDLTSYTFGTDVNWRWLRAGAEYEVYQSDGSDYTSMRLFQSFSFRPDDASSLGIELSESWTDYGDGDRHEENYRLVTRYNRGFGRRLRANIEGGIHLRRGEDRDQTLVAARPGIDYTIGKTTIRAGYDYEYQLYLNNEERNKHFFFLRIKRTF